MVVILFSLLCMCSVVMASDGSAPTSNFFARCLKSFRKKPVHKQEEQQDNEDCSICLESFSNLTSIAMLPCAHLYHANCVPKKKPCPLCRCSFEPSEITISSDIKSMIVILQNKCFTERREKESMSARCNALSVNLQDTSQTLASTQANLDNKRAEFDHYRNSTHRRTNIAFGSGIVIGAVSTAALYSLKSALSARMRDGDVLT